MERTNFAWLFAGLLLLLLLEPAVHAGSPELSAALEGAFSSLVLLGLWTLRSFRSWFRLALVLAALDLVSIVMFVSTGGDLWSLLSLTASLAFCTLSATLAMRFILTFPRIDANHLMGALSVYLLLGVIWTLLFTVLRTFDPGAFANVAAAPGQPGEIAELLYFSYVTLTTLGYGDVTPVAPQARTLAFLEAALGQLFIAVLIAILVSRLVRPSEMATPGGRS